MKRLRGKRCYRKIMGSDRECIAGDKIHLQKWTCCSRELSLFIAPHYHLIMRSRFSKSTEGGLDTHTQVHSLLKLHFSRESNVHF